MSKVDNYLFIKVFSDNNLTSMEKLLMLDLLTINGDLTSENCFINETNEEIANHLNCSASCVSKVVSSLIKKGYLEYYDFTGKNRVLKILLRSK